MVSSCKRHKNVLRKAYAYCNSFRPIKVQIGVFFTQYLFCLLQRLTKFSRGWGKGEGSREVKRTKGSPSSTQRTPIKGSQQVMTPLGCPKGDRRQVILHSCACIVMTHTLLVCVCVHGSLRPCSCAERHEGMKYVNFARRTCYIF